MDPYGQGLFDTLEAQHGRMLHLGDLQTEHEDILDRYGLAEIAENHLGEHALSLTQLTRVSVAYTVSVNGTTGMPFTEPCIRFATPDFQKVSSKLHSVTSMYDPVGRIENTRITPYKDYSDEDVDRVLDMLDSIKQAGFPYIADDMVSMLPTRPQK